MIRRIRRWRTSRAAFRRAVREIEDAGYHVSPATWARLRQEAAVAARDEASPAITNSAELPRPAVPQGDALTRARLPAQDDLTRPTP